MRVGVSKISDLTPAESATGWAHSHTVTAWGSVSPVLLSKLLRAGEGFHEGVSVCMQGGLVLGQPELASCCV